MIPRIGFGFDSHRLIKDRKLALGGVDIKSEAGTLAHSDGDVLIHSLIDALFGALALGDIGKHFPDSDPQYKGIDSKILLSKAYDIVLSKGYRISNIDSTICLQSPKLSPYIFNMRETLAGLLKISVEDVSVKATTNEKMGFVGREEGIAAYTVVILIKKGEK